MPRLYRLSRSDFQLVLKLKPRRFHGTHLSLAVYRSTEVIRGPKVGFVVPKKNVPRAHVRNKIERRCREILREMLKKGLPGDIYVIQVKKGVAEAPYADLQRDIYSLFEQAR